MGRMNTAPSAHHAVWRGRHFVVQQMAGSGDEVLIVGNFSDDPFAIDVAFAFGQVEEIADLISIKTFANGEFCPRFISDETDLSSIGSTLAGKTVVIVSTTNRIVSRNNLAMRNMLIARAAKDNGAASVVLVEPDLFYSAQDRGPHPDQGTTAVKRDEEDLKKFDGQPFSARLYAEMLKLAGVDQVVTIHNHSPSVQSEFLSVFDGNFHNLIPYDIYVDYLRESNIIDAGSSGERLALCAPDKGARDFTMEMFRRLDLPDAKFIMLDKERSGERDVEITLHPESDMDFEEIQGYDVVLFDDMVRTGSTVVRSCEFIQKVDPGRVVFCVTHFYASDEGREKLANPAIDEILTLNSLPPILNRDVQGRLRKKLVVLKIEIWLAQKLGEILGVDTPTEASRYRIDMSSKNPRFTRKIHGNDELSDLR